MVTTVWVQGCTRSGVHVHAVATKGRVGQGSDVPKVDNVNEKLLRVMMLPHRTRHLRLRREEAGGGDCVPVTAVKQVLERFLLRG